MNLKKIFIIIFLSLLLTGGTATPPAKSTPTIDLWQTQLIKFATIYATIKQNYPNPIEEEKFFYAAIKGLLKQLDPHSYFLDPVMKRSLYEDQDGKYYGIGTRITKYEDRLTVEETIAGTPAARLGIMAGDVITEIEGQDTRPMSVDDAMKILRGAKNTQAHIKIKRHNTLLPFHIERAEIPLNSVSYALPMPQAPELGYISVRTFGNTTVQEVETHIKQLQKENHIQGLILDLRGNTGGSLFAAVHLADFFLEKGKVIVSVKGRTLNRTMTAQDNNQFETLPLVILINRTSASASEVVAAALQDHKRALIIGSRSWGKGLVQSVNLLSLNYSLVLTTAKYYTPSNKCLQRDFKQYDDYFFFTNNTHYDTDNTVSGGVMPDILIAPETFPELLFQLTSRGILFNFALHLVNTEPSLSRQFKCDDAMIKKFILFLDTQQFTYKPEELEKNLPQLRYEITHQVISARFSPDEGRKIFLMSDPASIKAVEVLKKKYKR